jgi:hypothetical protein
MPYADFQLLVTNLVRDDNAAIDQVAARQRDRPRGAAL